ncbi:MAG: efflux RND transporter periplasmic adaptor subunit, partial [Isosphaeraceae bacterium]|nr:efflux RND transporter periplasmic adaptor subunit [Isosphaeraceae bacterium]
MGARGLSAVLSLGLILAVAVRGQTPSPPAAPAATATVETIPVELTTPDRYQIPMVLEPARRVTIVATSEGFVRSLSVPVGATVREGQEVAQLDRAEAAARLKIAQALLKEAQAEVEAAPKVGSAPGVAAARLEAAQARAELAQLALDRCTLRAPFAGRVLQLPISAGQFVMKGQAVAEVADVSSLRLLMPVDRAAVREGGNITVNVEGRTISGKVQTILPLPEPFAVLRELATPWVAAWVTIATPSGGLVPGLRVRDPFVPEAPITTLPSRAIHEGDKGNGTTVQVLRDEVVTDIPVRVLGTPGPERLQVTGPFRPMDAVIVQSSVPLTAGTLVHFGGGSGQPAAEIAPPAGAPRVAPIGAVDSALPKTPARPSGGPAPTSKPTTTPKS